VVLAAHSLGCILTAWWAAHSRHTAKVRGALLVAPGDVEQADVAAWIPGWAPIARQRLPFPAVLVGSRNDPYCRFERAQALASDWGARFIDAGERGHINAESGLGDVVRRHGTAAIPLERLNNNMVTKKPKGLGRGLEALLGPKVAEAAEQAQAADAGLPSSLRLDDMVPGMYQPRTRMDEGALYELAESIKAQGIMQPILVRRLAEGAHAGKYEIIAGERRFRAARLAGLEVVPVLVREVPNEAAAAMALIENIQREDLNPLEEAQGLQRLVREFGLTHEQAAQAVGRSRSAASNLLRLLNLAEPVQTMLMAGDIDMGHARALLALDRAAQITAGNQIAAKKLSVREAEALVKKIGAEFSLVPQKPKKEKSRDIKRVEEELSDLLMAEVEVRVKKRVKRAGRMEDVGELAIQFGSLDALNGLIERLRGH
jgi:ParB family chromosome partitioning protein